MKCEPISIARLKLKVHKKLDRVGVNEASNWHQLSQMNAYSLHHKSILRFRRVTVTPLKDSSQQTVRRIVFTQ